MRQHLREQPVACGGRHVVPERKLAAQAVGKIQYVIVAQRVQTGGRGGRGDRDRIGAAVPRTAPAVVVAVSARCGGGRLRRDDVRQSEPPRHSRALVRAVFSAVAAGQREGGQLESELIPPA
jgi:hypothetical protein